LEGSFSLPAVTIILAPAPPAEGELSLQPVIVFPTAEADGIQIGALFPHIETVQHLTAFGAHSGKLPFPPGIITIIFAEMSVMLQ
jgi:hypothetical protein